MYSNSSETKQERFPHAVSYTFPYDFYTSKREKESKWNCRQYEKCILTTILQITAKWVYSPNIIFKKCPLLFVLPFESCSLNLLFCQVIDWNSDFESHKGFMLYLLDKVSFTVHEMPSPLEAAYLTQKRAATCTEFLTNWPCPFFILSSADNCLFSTH